MRFWRFCGIVCVVNEAVRVKHVMWYVCHVAMTLGCVVCVSCGSDTGVCCMCVMWQ